MIHGETDGRLNGRTGRQTDAKTDRRTGEQKEPLFEISKMSQSRPLDSALALFKVYVSLITFYLFSFVDSFFRLSLLFNYLKPTHPVFDVDLKLRIMQW